MYGMVLMAALATGTDIPDWGRGGWGCCGCYGGGYGGYYGYGRGYGWGGYGRGYGWGGSGWGGYGWGGYGMGGYGYGGYVLNVPASGYYWGGYGVPGYAMASTAPMTTPTTTRSMYYSPGTVSDGSRAIIRVHLPAEATLLVDGKRTTSVSDVRQFVSPPLDPDKDYHYTLKAEMNRDGKTLTTTRRVDVRAGKTEEVYLNFSNLDETDARPGGPADSTRRRNDLDRP